MLGTVTVGGLPRNSRYVKRELHIRALIAALVIAALFGAAWGQKAEASTGLTVFVVNQSTVITDAQVLDALPVFQSAVSNEFARAWGTDAALYLTGKPPAGSWTITIQDTSNMPGALGYHDFVNGSPIGYVFAQSSIDNNINWQEVFTHELFELLADPYINRLAIGTKLWLVEPCDQVEDPTNDYVRLSPSGQQVLISDFVYPNWYKPKTKGPYDYTGILTKPEQLAKGGYVSYWTTRGWQQLFARTTKTLQP